MDLDTGKERILARLKSKGLLTDTEMITCLENDVDLFKRLRIYLIENNYAKDFERSGLVYLERDPAQGKKQAPAGNPETCLKIDPDLTAEKKDDVLKPPHFAFISYGRKEKEIELVTQLKKDLLNSKDPAYPDPLVSFAFLDTDNIEKAAVFDKTIEENIEDSTVFLAVISPHALRKESICRDETVYAYNNRKPIVPLMFRFEKDSKLPLLLCRRNWIDFSGDYTEAFSSLCRYLAGDQTAAKPPLHPLILGKEPLDFGPEIARYSDNFAERHWIDDKISDWIQYSSTPGFVIIGNPGSGKSAISAWLSSSRQEQVIGIHFCSSLNPRSLDQMEFVGNLVAQLFTQIPEYAEIIKKKESHTVFNNATRAFRELVIEPLTSIKNPDLTPQTPKIIIVDSFDEAIQMQNGNIFNLLLQQIDYLPFWLRIIATTRPEKGIIDVLGSKFTRLDLSDNHISNNEDIGRYIDTILHKENFLKILGEKKVDLTSFKTALIRQSAGIFLYIVYVMKAILEGDIDPKRPEMFPKDLVGFYLRIFQKKFPKDTDYAPVKKILGVLIAAKEPLTSAELAVFLEKDSSEIESALRPLASLFTRNNSMQYRLYHNSLKEWLKGTAVTEKKYEDTQYQVNLTQGNRIITDRCWQEFENGVQTMSAYAVAYLPVHLTETGRYKELVKLLQNPKFFVKSWQNNEFTIKIAWARIEKDSDFRMIDSYKEVIETPARYPDEFVMVFSEFLTDTGHHNESIILLEHVLKIYIRQFNEDKIQHCLAQLAWALFNVRSYERSGELLRLHEFICKNRDDLFNLQIGVGYMANIVSPQRSIDLNCQQEHYCRILGEKGKYWAQKSIGNRGNTLWGMELRELAFCLYRQKEQISKEINDYQGLQWAYGYQAQYYQKTGNKKRSLELYSQQYDLAQSISYFRGIKMSLESQKEIYDSDGDVTNTARIESSLDTLHQAVVSPGITVNPSNRELFDELEHICADKEQEYLHAKDNRGLSRILPYKAYLLEIKKEYEKALLVYEELEKIGDSISSPTVVNNARRNAWWVYCEKGELQHVIEMPEKYPEAFIPIWAKYDLLNFLDLLIIFLSEKKETEMIEPLLEYQIGYAGIDRLIIPFSSFMQHITWAGDKKDIGRIVWLVSHKTEFDMAIQFMALKNLSPEQVQQVVTTAKDIALAYYYWGDFSESYAVYDSLKGYYAIVKDPVAKEKIIGDMGLNKEALGEFEQALSYYNDQAGICKEASLFEDYAWAVSNQGDVLRKLGRLDKALELYREQEKISKEHNLVYWLNRAKENIGNIYKDYGQYAQALGYYEQINANGDDRAKLKFFGRALENQADIFYRTGEIKKAVETYLRAADRFTEPSDLFDQWRILTKCAVLDDTLNLQEDYVTCINRKRQLIPLIKTEQLFSYLLSNQDHIHTIRFDLDLIYEWDERNQLLKKISEKSTLPAGRSLPQPMMGPEHELIQPEEFAMIQKIGDLCSGHKFEMGLQYYFGFKGLYETITQDNTAARSSLSHQQEQCKKIGYVEGLQIALGRVADIFCRSGDSNHAKLFTEEQLVLARDLNSPEALLRGNQRLVDILLSHEDYEGARKQLEEIHTSAEDIGSFWQVIVSCYKMGLINQLVGSYEDAQKYFKLQEVASRKTGDRYYTAIAVVKQAEILGTMGKDSEITGSLR